jgi:hypothetical protein
MAMYSFQKVLLHIVLEAKKKNLEEEEEEEH